MAGLTGEQKGDALEQINNVEALLHEAELNIVYNDNELLINDLDEAINVLTGLRTRIGEIVNA